MQPMACRDRPRPIAEHPTWVAHARKQHPAAGNDIEFPDFDPVRRLAEAIADAGPAVPSPLKPAEIVVARAPVS